MRGAGAYLDEATNITNLRLGRLFPRDCQPLGLSEVKIGYDNDSHKEKRRNYY